jgi:hypothetical protein
MHPMLRAYEVMMPDAQSDSAAWRATAEPMLTSAKNQIKASVMPMALAGIVQRVCILLIFPQNGYQQ